MPTVPYKRTPGFNQPIEIQDKQTRVEIVGGVPTPTVVWVTRYRTAAMVEEMSNPITGFTELTISGMYTTEEVWKIFTIRWNPSGINTSDVILYDGNTYLVKGVRSSKLGMNYIEVVGAFDLATA